MACSSAISLVLVTTAYSYVTLTFPVTAALIRIVLYSFSAVICFSLIEMESSNFFETL